MHHTTIQTQGQADSATEFVVLSPSDFQNDGNGFWSNNEGWTTLEHAQRYDSTDSPLLIGQMYVPLDVAIDPAGFIRKPCSG